MWPFSSHRFSSLKGRLVFSAVVPGVLAAIFLCALLGWVLTSQQERKQEASWQASLTLLASLAEIHLQQGNREGLQLLANTGLTLPQIRTIVFLDTHMAVLSQAGVINRRPENLFTASRKTSDWQPFTFSHDNRIRHVWPIKAADSRQLLGWLDVEFASDEQQLLLYRNLILLGLILLAVTCVAIVLASLLFSRTTSGFRNIQQQLYAISQGDFNAQIPPDDNEELNLLINILNQAITTFATHQRELQEHINQSTQDLRETLETIEIQNIELDLARKEALNASKIKSEFLANTSHEIRTPLNGIIGFTRLLLKDCQDSQQQEYLTTIQQSSENLLNLINDILDLSKIEAGKLVLEYDSFNVHHITEETLQILAPSAHEKGLELAHLIDAQVPDCFYGDAPRLKQILTNLIGNAIKFSNTGSILVRITLENSENNSALIKCSVSDTGIGIRRSQLNKDLFSAFSQSGGNTPQQRSGAGLGLAISKKLVNQMGGDIGIDSEENVGSTFWFTIKLDIDHQRIDTAEKPRLNTRQFLLFDTNAASRQSLINLFTSWGARLSITQSYSDMLPTLSANSSQPPEVWFSAALISIPVDTQNFPIDQLKDLVISSRKYCPVIVNASTSLRHYLEKILPEDTIYLSKPVTQQKLIQALQACKITLPDHTQKNSTPSPTSLQPVSAGHTRMLVVDDQKANLALLSRLLRDLGHQVEEASNGRDALSLCQQYTFDCIFMDIRMPGMDGVETTQRIRMLDNANRNVPVIAVTAQAMADQKQQLLLAGLDDYLSKPIQENLLSQTIARWSKRSAIAISDTAGISDDSTIDNCIDISLCLKLSHGKAALAVDMLTMLLDELPTARNEINQALNESRFNDARELIHKLHGACCYCGVPALKTICNKLESHLNIQSEAPSSSDRNTFDLTIDALLNWKEQHEIRDLFG